MSDPSHETPSDENRIAVPTVDHADDLDDTLVQDAASVSKAAELSSRDVDPPADVPGYTIVRRLGEGAYGSVWLAVEGNTGKQVAIKFYSHRRGLDWSLLNREVEKMAVLYTSRNIVGLLDVGWDSDPPYYVMEHLENGSLEALLEGGPLPVHEAVRIARSILHALVHAHGSGILHCDLKPANVLLDADYEPRLCDFGQSRLSDEQDPALGTLFYMAPEQANLQAVPDARWDVYALGALFYQMLVGRAPYRTPENEQRIQRAGNLERKLAEYRRALKESPKPNAHRSVRGVDRRLAEIIDRCLRIDPERRLANAQVVLDLLDERDRQRSRRPLLVLGVVFPVILLLLMIPIAKTARDEAVSTASGSLTRRVLSSDYHSAKNMSRSIQRDLDDRLAELVEITEEIDLAQALKQTEEDVLQPIRDKTTDETTNEELIELRKETWPTRKKIFQKLEARKTRSDRVRKELNRSRDRSWFVTDAEGFQRWRNPVDLESTLDVQFNFRDYFHGHKTEYSRDDVPDDLQPIQKPYVSLAFRSLSTKKFMVALSVPIRDRETGEVVGILARTMDLGELLADYTTALTRGNNANVLRSVVLVENADGKLLDHPWMTNENLEALSRVDVNLQSLSLGEDVRKQIQRLQKSTSRGKARTSHRDAEVDRQQVTRIIEDHARDPYYDPIGKIELESAKQYRGEWLAAFAPVGDTGWTVIVQERRGRALEPINDMKSGLFRSAVYAFLLFIGLIVAVWGFVVWRLYDRPSRRRKDGASVSPASGLDSSTIHPTG